MLFPLALRHDSGSILPSLAEFENTENPDMDQVGNFSNSDGEVGQPAYEGPQTQSHTRKLMKANCLLANLFDVEKGDLCDEVSDVLLVTNDSNESNYPAESLRTLILESWYKQVFTFYGVCCDLAEAGVHSIYC